MCLEQKQCMMEIESPENSVCKSSTFTQRNATHHTNKQATLPSTSTSTEARRRKPPGPPSIQATQSNNSPTAAFTQPCIIITTGTTTTSSSSGRQSTTLSFSCSKKPRSLTWVGKWSLSKPVPMSTMSRICTSRRMTWLPRSLKAAAQHVGARSSPGCVWVATLYIAHGT